VIPVDDQESQEGGSRLLVARPNEETPKAHQHRR
jgi:hypothetical protein